jgi:integrase
MQHFTIEELKGLLKEIKSQSTGGEKQAAKREKQRLMVVVGFWHGLRVSELTSLKGADIKDGYINCQRRKGSLHTIQPFIHHDDPYLDEAAGLTELARVVGDDELLFPMTRNGVLKLMQRAGKRAGLPEHKLHPHILKHSIAMQTIKESGIENVRQWLGHKSIASTGEYLKVSDDAAARIISKSMGATLGT